MPGKNIDVNVHPTKLEVQFLHEEKILEMIQKEFDKNLQPASSERTMKLSETFFSPETSCLLDITLPSQSQSKNRADHKLVREDSQQNTLDSFLVPKADDDSFEIGRKKVPISRKRKAESQNINLTFSGEQKRQVLSLDSMKELESERISKPDEELKMILTNFSVVGAISPSRFAIQHDVNLMLLDLEPITYDLFYQIILRDYGNFSHVTIEPGIDIEEVLKTTNILSNEKSTKLLKKLKKSGAMLEDYFSIRIGENGYLESMPVILDGWRPTFNLIYNFLGDLADVDWSSEKQCLEGISKEDLLNVRTILNSVKICVRDRAVIGIRLILT